MENLGRGVIATKTATNTALISWRLYGTEPTATGFNLYRKTGTAAPVKLNTAVLTAGTNFEDRTANFSQAQSYYVTHLENNIESPPSTAFTLPANTPVQPYYDVPIQNLPDYTVKFIWTGDLDGDGEMDFIFDRQPVLATGTIVVEAYTSKGSFLWRMDCGPNSVNRYNIAPGSSAVDIGHGDGLTVYDINNDGMAEVMVKTSNGVKFGDGRTLQNSDNVIQFVSVLEGTTGREINRVQIPNATYARGPQNGWFGIAYLDGINPSIYFGGKNRNDDKSFNMELTAWTWRNGGLVRVWNWVRNNQRAPDGHNIRALDIDGDGRDEIVPMGFAIDDNGRLLWSLETNGGIVHGDRHHIADLDPARPGLEGYVIQQDNASGLAWAYYDAKDGSIIHRQVLRNPDGTPDVRDMARGAIGDVDPRFPGYEFWTFTEGIFNVSGRLTSNGITDSYPNLRIWWDGDVLSECLDNGKFIKWNYTNSTESRLVTARDVVQIGPKTPGILADIVGDWREEAVYPRSDQRALRVYTSPYFTTTRIYTLLHNPAYRNGVTCKGYYQGNHVDYFLGNGMATPPRPNIRLTGNMDPNNTAPVVSITAPVNNATFAGPASVTISANATDADGTIARVEFYNGTVLLGTDNTSPFSFLWSNVAAGSYTVTARAIDNDNAVATSAPITIRVTASSNPPPVVSITSPADNASFTGVPAQINVSADATDVNGTVSKVDFYQGNVLIGSDLTAPFSITWSNVAAGAYALKAIATDNGGATDTSSVIGVTVGDIQRDCNGDAGGAAALDKCGRCVGGRSGRLACATILEAEEACVFDGVVDDLHDGYNGSGFVDGTAGVGNSITFAITAPLSGNYSIAFRYANGAATNRPGGLEVNSINLQAQMAFTPTNTWEEWEILEVAVPLVQGNNTLVLKSLAANGLPNLDQIHLISSGLSQGYCPPLGVNDTEMQGHILLYPNPSAKGFNIQLSALSEVKVYSLQGTLLDDLGRVSFTQFGDHYEPGMYLVYVTTSELNKVYKIVKK